MYNYVIENDERNNYEKVTLKTKKGIKSNNKKYFIGIFVILTIIVIVFVSKIIKFQGSYEYLENKLEKSAAKYIRDNNINSNQEFFIAAKKLNVSLSNDCQNLSGVFIKDNRYEAYLSCGNYETNILNNKSNYIKLNGKDITFLYKGMEYSEVFYESLQNDITVNINGKVDKEEGVYSLEYIVIKSGIIVDVLERKVVVVDNSYINTLYPTISLLGDAVIQLKVSDKYEEAGVVATDITDGVLNDVKIIGNVDTSIDGEYNLVYVATNSKGYANAVTRKIIVSKKEKVIVEETIKPTITTNQSVKINMNIFGNNYSYTMLPDGGITIETNIKYEVLKNGIYTFKIYDDDGNYQVKDINITNIDKELPNGTCEAIVNNKSTIISVNASDDYAISGYSYIIDGNDTGYIVSNTYEFSSKAKSVSVNIKDAASNIKKIDCTITNKSTDDMTIVPIPSVSFKCNTNVDYYNAQLANRVSEAGIKTRAGVVAAANYLATELGYRIEYWWAGKYNKVGLNSEWGCDKKIWASDGSGKYAQGNVLPYGMDCTGFVKWAFIQAGFDESLIPKSYMASENYGNSRPRNVKFSENSDLINNLQIGDLLKGPNHYALVVGVDDTRIKIAQLTPRGVGVDLINKKTGTPITATSSFTSYVLLEDFYQTYGN